MRRVRSVLLALALVGACASPALAGDATSEPPDGHRDNSVEGIFAPGSPWYQKLPDDTPIDPNSEVLIESLHEQAEEYFGSPGDPNLTINTKSFTAPLWVSTNADPVYDIQAWNCQDKPAGWEGPLVEQLEDVHLPAGFVPDESTDANVSIFNEDTDRLVEMWRARQTPEGGWEACWGGEIQDAGTSDGTFEVPYGASAGGMALAAYTIRHDELLDGKIEHIVGIGIPRTKEGVFSWPANRTDGRTQGTELAMGQMLRLPADFDLDSLTLSPAARTLAEAAQDYGLIVADTSGAVAFAAEHEFSVADNKYDTIFRGRGSHAELAGDPARGEDPFPLERLVALPMDYRVPAEEVTPPPPPTAGTSTTEDDAAATASPAARADHGADAPKSVPPVTGILLAVGGLALLAAGALALLRRRPRA